MIDTFINLKTKISDKEALESLAEIELQFIELETKLLQLQTKLLEKDTTLLLLTDTLRAIAYKTDEELSMINGKAAANLAANALLMASLEIHK